MPPRYIALPPKNPNFGTAKFVDYLVRQRDPSKYEPQDDMCVEIQISMDGKRRCRLEKASAHLQRIMEISKREADSMIEQVITTENSIIFKQRVYKDGGYDFYTFNEKNERELIALAEKQEKSYAKKHAAPIPGIFD